MSDTRIEQFKNMTEADPENELGHFSLGKAYLDAGQFDEAASSLRHDSSTVRHLLTASLFMVHSISV